MHVTRVDDHTVNVYLKTPREIGMLRGRSAEEIPGYREASAPITATYYKSAIWGSIAAFFGYAFEVVDETTQEKFYLERESVVKNLASNFNISSLDKRINTVVFARAFDLRHDGTYVFKEGFRRELKAIHEQQAAAREKAEADAEQRAEEAKAKSARAPEEEHKASAEDEMVFNGESWVPRGGRGVNYQYNYETGQYEDQTKVAADAVLNPRTGQLEAKEKAISEPPKRSLFERLFGVSSEKLAKEREQELAKQKEEQDKKDNVDFFG